MKIADNLELLRANKDSIRNAITRKGVLTGSDMSTYADNIMKIGRGVFPDIPDLSPITIQDDVMYLLSLHMRIGACLLDLTQVSIRWRMEQL